MHLCSPTCYPVQFIEFSLCLLTKVVARLADASAINEQKNTQQEYKDSFRSSNFKSHIANKYGILSCRCISASEPEVALCIFLIIHWLMMHGGGKIQVPVITESVNMLYGFANIFARPLLGKLFSLTTTSVRHDHRYIAFFHEGS